MIPIETLTRWSAFLGAVSLFSLNLGAYLPKKRLQLKRPGTLIKKFALGFATAILVGNGLVFLHTIRGDFWKELGTYRELKSHLITHPRTCAVLTVREISSVLLPFNNRDQFPVPAYGSFRAEPEKMNFEGTKAVTLTWAESAPHCEATETILLHVRKPEKAWQDSGCELLPSGILKLVPKVYWDWAIENHLASGSWYNCPGSITGHFADQKIVHLFSKSFGHIESLPRAGITARELEDLGYRTSPPPADSYLPRLPSN